MLSTAKRSALPRMLLLAAVVATAVALGVFAAPERAEAQNCDTTFTIEPLNGYWARIERHVPPCDTSVILTHTYLRGPDGHLVPDSEPPPGNEPEDLTPVHEGGRCFSRWGQPTPCQPETSRPVSTGPAPPVSGREQTAPPVQPVQPDDLFQDLPPDLRDLILRFLPI